MSGRRTPRPRARPAGPRTGTGTGRCRTGRWWRSAGNPPRAPGARTARGRCGAPSTPSSRAAVGSPCPVWVAVTAASSVASRARSLLEHRRRVPGRRELLRRGERAVQDLVPAGGVHRPGGADQPVGEVLVRGRVHRRGPHRQRQRQVAGVVEPHRHRERDVHVPAAARALIHDHPPAGRPDQVGDRGGVPPHRVRAAAGGVEIDDQHTGVARGGVDRHRRRHRRQPRRQRSFPPPQIRVPTAAGLPHPGTPRQQRRQGGPRCICCAPLGCGVQGWIHTRGAW